MAAPDPASLDGSRLERLTRHEHERFIAEHPRSRELFERTGHTLLGGVPMSWMTKWAGGFPVFAESAEGSTVVDVDGHSYVDFCLGDTGAMAGHDPGPTAAAAERQFGRGATLMLPTEDAPLVGEELRRRFGLAFWQLTLSATDANRFALRMGRQVTGRPRVLVFNYCYHGTVDESFITLEHGRPRSREGNVGPAVDPTGTTKVVEFNDLRALERALEPRDVACVLAEPALTNIGIVLPQPGFHEALRELTRRTGTLLVIDETHTLSAGPGGCTRAWGLKPDVLTVGKAIAGGIPAGAFGMSAETAERVRAESEADYEDVGGVGGTLAGNALSLAAVRATLEQVLTDEAYARMLPLCERFVDGVERALAERAVPWHIVRLGARAEYRFCPEPPRNGGEAALSGDEQLEEYMHLYALNRGVLITPFHNMALMSPATTEEDVNRHSEVFAAALDDLLAA